MDEVGLIVTGITSDGMLRFATVGGIDARVLVGRSVLVGNSIPGVIGTKAVHMQSAEEKAKATPVDQLYIDIGAKDKEDALQYVSLGESVCFQSEPVEFGNNCLKDVYKRQGIYYFHGTKQWGFGIQCLSSIRTERGWNI